MKRATAIMCPECGALLAQELIGSALVAQELHGEGQEALRCGECARTSPLAEWVTGVWTEARRALADASELGGDIVGESDPYERDNLIVDTRYAVLLDRTDVVMTDNPSDGRRICMVLLQGRVNQSTKRTRVGYLASADGVAGMVSELVAIAAREGGEFEEEFSTVLAERMSAITAEAEARGQG